jgi:hypothetical protein
MRVILALKTIPRGWREVGRSRVRRPVAWMYASYEDPAAGRTFISFCGSVDNYIGYAAGNKETINGWYPSASPGLHAIIESLSNERSGVGDWTRLMSEPGRHEFYNLLSALSELPRGHIVGQAYMEVLAAIFHSEHDVKITFNGPSGFAATSIQYWLAHHSGSDQARQDHWEITCRYL